MDNQIGNRVEMELEMWKSKEERLSKMFSFNLSSNKGLLTEKLHYYERIAAKYKSTPDLDERMALRVLRQERNQIERKLYPNLLVRLLRRLFIAPIREQIVIRNDLRQAQQNSQSLQVQLQRAGFSGLSTKLDEHLKQGKLQFSIPVSYQINEKERIDHALSFQKDQSGQYRLDGFTTSLHNESKPEESRQHFFDTRQVTDVTQAYNLMSGRAIYRDNVWSQLDFNDRNAQGSYRTKQFRPEYGYDLGKVLQQLPIKDLENKMEKLRDALQQGSKQAVSFEKDGKEQRYYIEANPQFKSVNIFDEHSRKITLATASGIKAMETVKTINKLDEKREEKQVDKKHLRIS